MMTVIRYLILVLCLFMFSQLPAQVHGAKITYERKTNLYKKFKRHHNISNWVKEEEKIKIDYFELFITDTFSLFKPQESELRENLSWATAKNTIYQDFKKHYSFQIKTIWGEQLHLTDTLLPRVWHLSESSRKIAGYTCRKAVWRANDSTRIHAWFSYDLQPSTGPETFNGLPGTILGLATEDGGVVYFAKKVEILKPEPALFITPKKKKMYTVEELKKQFDKQYSHEWWYKDFMLEQFGIW